MKYSFDINDSDNLVRQCWIQPLTLENTSNYHDCLNDSEVNKYMRHGHWRPVTKADCTSHIENSLSEKTDSDYLIFGIWHPGEGHIGNVTVRDISPIDRTAEIGIVIWEKSKWGQGIGGRAVEVAVYYCLNILNLERVLMGCASGNFGIKKVIEKNGFKLEAKLNSWVFCDGEYHDQLFYTTE